MHSDRRDQSLNPKPLASDSDPRLLVGTEYRHRRARGLCARGGGEGAPGDSESTGPISLSAGHGTDLA